MTSYNNLRANETGIYLGGEGTTALHYRGDRHIVVIGPTGACKDSSLLTPLIANCHRSLFIVDPEGEQAAITARWRSTFSRIVCINPFDVFVNLNPLLKSLGFNPLRLDPKSADFIDQCVQIALALVKVDPRETQKYFAETARALLCALIIWEVLTRGANASLANVRDMLCAPMGEDDNKKPIGFSKTVADIIAMADKNPLDPNLRAARNKIAEFAVMTRALRDVIGSAKTATDFLESEPIRKDLSRVGFDFATMKDEIVTVYVIIPRISEYGTWLRLLLSMVLESMMRTVPNPAMPKPLLIFNEVAQADHLELLPKAHGRARKWYQIMTIWQSLNQITANYGKAADTILGARGALVSFAPKDLESAKYLSELCGQYGEVVKSRTLKPDEPAGSSGETVQSFSLVRPDDLMRLDRCQTLNFVEAVKYPFMASAPQFWELEHLVGKLDPNPYHLAGPATQTASSSRAKLDDLKRRRS